jgi:hypothetical protein
MIRPCIVLTSLLSLSNLGAIATRSVSLDQVGYKWQSAKYVFVSSSADSFCVLDAATNSVRFVGQLILWRASDPARQIIRKETDDMMDRKIQLYGHSISKT